MRSLCVVAAIAAVLLGTSACGGKSADDKYMDALGAANFPATLLADRTDAIKVGRDMCGADEKSSEFQLMSQLNLSWTKVQALDKAAHTYPCKHS